MEKLLSRAEVPVEQTWDLTGLYPTQEAFEADLATVAEDAASLRKFRGRLGDGTATVLECLRTELGVLMKWSRLNGYAFNSVSADGLSSANQDAYARAISAMTAVHAETSFVEPELLALPSGTLERCLAEEPALLPWRCRLLRIVADRPHRLPADVEHAMASLSEVLELPFRTYGLWRVSDLAFPDVKDAAGAEHPMTMASYDRVYERASDNTLRRNAYRAFSDSLGRYKNTIAALWSTQLRKNVLLARLQGYHSAIEMLLSQQDVSIDVFDRIHDVILGDLAPQMRRLAELRRRVLGLDQVLYCDIEADLDPGYAPVSTFDQARNVIVEGLSVLGEEYQNIIKSAFSERWIDWANNQGKTSDCFCGSSEPHPYVLIGWDGTMRSTMVLAHELGHAAHGYLTNKYQEGYNRRSSLLLLEASSTTTEAIVGKQMMERSPDPRMRRWVIMHLLTSYYHNFVRHLIESELQRRLYPVAEADRPVTADLLCKVQGEILSEFWGDAVTIDEGARLTWMRQGHYYNQQLYSWSYSGGLTIGVAVVRALQREGTPAAERWVNVLKAGGSLPPLDLAKMAGADLTKPDAMRDAVRYVGELIDELVRSF